MLSGSDPCPSARHLSAVAGVCAAEAAPVGRRGVWMDRLRAGSHAGGERLFLEQVERVQPQKEARRQGKQEKHLSWNSEEVSAQIPACT